MSSTDTEFAANLKQLGRLVAKAKTILVLQPEKPDTDSLCSALVLEHLLGDLGKEVVLYCQDEVPPYINYFPGVDRLTDVLPNQFDLSILVDTGSPTQMQRTLEKHQGRLAAKPFVIIDHHGTRTPMPFAAIEVIDAQAAATGELLVRIAAELSWALNAEAASLVVPAIMSDTLGLATPSVTAATVQTVADMVRLGANLAAINDARLAAGALDPDVLQLKGRLLQQVEFLLDGRLALLMVDAPTLKEYAKRYDPSALVIYDMQHARGVQIAIVIRNYAPKLKLSLRANGPYAAPVAAEFGGGGHAQASGATIEAGQPDDIRAKVIAATQKVLDEAADAQS
ncbi:MAG TPA: DHH family phosphoesterase [Candidatus Saccharimonadia bacterium]|nr:DHH family phosphoesterase [Candidatus Saccharimonadia bacterium]